MESGTTINRGNENLFDDASFLPFPRFLGFHRVSHVTSEPIGDTRLHFLLGALIGQGAVILNNRKAALGSLTITIP